MGREVGACCNHRKARVLRQTWEAQWGFGLLRGREPSLLPACGHHLALSTRHYLQQLQADLSPGAPPENGHTLAGRWLRWGSQAGQRRKQGPTAPYLVLDSSLRNSGVTLVMVLGQPGKIPGLTSLGARTASGWVWRTRC